MNQVYERWKDRRILRWIISQWCNYSCWYCRQDHSRKQTYEGNVGHWTDAAPVEKWLEAFERHYSNRKLTVFITGGEPFLHRLPFDELLDGLNESEWCECVKVDTNMSWDASKFYCRHDKVRLMASWHPSETSWQGFLRQLTYAQLHWTVSVVNVVATPDRVGSLGEWRDDLAKLSLPLNVLPAFSHLGQFTSEQVVKLQEHISLTDWPHRTRAATFGSDCLFPSIAHEMLPAGQIIAGCHAEESGSFFDEELPPLPTGYTSCPLTDCHCDDKNYFLRDRSLAVGGAPVEHLATRIPLA